MERDLATLSSREVDILVVGGGMFGICAARDAVLRGMSVALVERNDFAGGTSAHSFKMVHGGVRYIQHADLVRVRESCRERSALLRIAPHLVQPLPIVVPTYGHGRSGKTLLAAGLLAYDVITFDRNRGIADRDRRIPRSRFLSASQAAELFPSLKRPDLTGAAVFSDAQMYNPTRLALATLRSGVEAGAMAANYVEATDFLWSGARVIGIAARDRLSGEQFDVRARMVLNAAGPWAEGLLAKHDRLRLKRKTTYSRDVCFVVRHRLNDRYAVAVSASSRDPDAVLSRGARHLFIAPWRDYSLIGVWHRLYDGDPDRVQVDEAELAAFMDEINEAYPGLDLDLSDVSMCNSGLLPFGENRPDARDLSYGKRSILVDHAREHQVEGLVTLIGIRYTMGRGDAAKAVDLIARKLNHRSPRPATDRIPVFGGRIERFESFVQEQQRHWQGQIPAPVLRALVQNYGTEFRRVLDYATENPELLERVGAGQVTRAEIIHAVREEMALRLGDVVFRRTDLATGEHPGPSALAACAQLMADELGWNAERVRVELDDVERAFPPMARTLAAEEPLIWA
jgi:glycerol-3-phosphate dehydrogenase